GISHRRIGWAGTKDKRAITTQFISIYNGEREQVERLHIKDLSLEVIGRSPVAISLGMLEGNRFAITIRECERDSLSERVDSVAETVSHGIPNYVGLQRFGVIRPITHRVGELILNGDYEGAALAYIGEAFPHEPSDIREARNAFSRTLDIKAALKQYPTHLSYERSMLHHLDSHPGDYGGALQVLPPKLLSMFVSAFQSVLFNHALSMRLLSGLDLTTPVPGDALVFPNGRVDTVSEQNQFAAALHIRRGRAKIALFIPGSRKKTEEFTPSMRLLLTERGISEDNFKRAAEFVKTSFEGAYRPVSLSTQITTRVTESDLHLEFLLDPGQYATTVCREFMKAEPLRMV
ncbi:MAG TPA: tRNA pseudouridine(13) synthase TruD, partial [Methanomicrobiales archaeon]|nr:tRNA pseudouridine(13) synthase TruD [Methanomicrobiales archaeon]